MKLSLTVSHAKLSPGGAIVPASCPGRGHCVVFLAKANLMLGLTLRLPSIPFRGGGGGGREILLVTSLYRNWDKPFPDDQTSTLVVNNTEQKGLVRK